MNPEQAKKFIANYPNAKSFVKPSHLEELSPLLEVHIEAITVRKDEFHDISGSYMPRKETLDKFAAAAGVSYNASGESTRMDGARVYVGRSQAMVMGPDGKMIMGDACEYEFNVDVRLEEMVNNGKPDWDNKVNGRPGTKKYTELEVTKERIQLQKVGRQRANTGARNRATSQVLGMQTGFKNLFSKEDSDSATKTFLFSRIIVNAKNELVMNRMLDNLGPNTAMLYGGSPAHVQIAASSRESDPPMKQVVEQAHAQPQDDPFAEPPKSTTETQVDPVVMQLQEDLIGYLQAGFLKPNGRQMIQDALDRGESDVIILRDLVSKAKSAYEMRA